MRVRGGPRVCRHLHIYEHVAPNVRALLRLCMHRCLRPPPPCAYSVLYSRHDCIPVGSIHILPEPLTAEFHLRICGRAARGSSRTSRLTRGSMHARICRSCTPYRTYRYGIRYGMVLCLVLILCPLGPPTTPRPPSTITAFPRRNHPFAEIFGSAVSCSRSGCRSAHTRIQRPTACVCRKVGHEP